MFRENTIQISNNTNTTTDIINPEKHRTH